MHDEGERRKKRGPEVRETTESFIGASRKCRNNSEKFVQEYVQKKTISHLFVFQQLQNHKFLHCHGEHTTERNSVGYSKINTLLMACLIKLSRRISSFFLFNNSITALDCVIENIERTAREETMVRAENGDIIKFSERAFYQLPYNFNASQSSDGIEWEDGRFL